MPRILVAKTLVHAKQSTVKGYIYVEGDTIRAIGEDDPPEELQLAELVIGGPGRLAVVGLTTIASLEALPYRSKLYAHTLTGFLSSSEAGKIARNTSRERAYNAALLGLYELVVHGYSSVISIDPHAEVVARAYRDTRASGAILVPMGCKYSPEKPLEELDGLLQAKPPGVLAGILLCGEEKSLTGEISSSYPEAVIATLSRQEMRAILPHSQNHEIIVADLGLLDEATTGPMRILSPFIAITIITSKGHSVPEALEALTQPYHALREGKADITIVEALEPPCYPPSIENLAGCTPRIETLISGGALLVDTGQPIILDREVLEKAAKNLLREQEA